MEHVVIQVVDDCFQLGPSFLKPVFITHSNMPNYWHSQTPSFRGKSSDMKMEPLVCVCGMCVCDKIRVGLNCNALIGNMVRNNWYTIKYQYYFWPVVQNSCDEFYVYWH